MAVGLVETETRLALGAQEVGGVSDITHKKVSRVNQDFIVRTGFGFDNFSAGIQGV